MWLWLSLFDSLSIDVNFPLQEAYRKVIVFQLVQSTEKDVLVLAEILHLKDIVIMVLCEEAVVCKLVDVGQVDEALEFDVIGWAVIAIQSIDGELVGDFGEVLLVAELEDQYFLLD